MLASRRADACAQITQLAAESQRPVHEVEREVLGSSHAEVGAYLLGTWGLPFQVVEAVAHHHEPSRVQSEPGDLLPTIHVASALAEWAIDRRDLPDTPLLIDERVAAIVGSREALEDWQAAAIEEAAVGAEAVPR